MTRTRHTEEFKREAVKLALESDETYKVISDNLGINLIITLLVKVFLEH